MSVSVLSRAALAAVASCLVLFAASPAQAFAVSGNIAVFRDNTQIGYVRSTFDGQNSYTFGALANALSVQIDPVTSLFDIRALNGPDAAHPFVGAVGGSGGYNFSAGQLGYAYLSGTGHTDAGSVPSFTAGTSIQALGYSAPAESMIWSHVGSTLAAQWVNSNGTVSTAQAFYDPSVDFLGLVGDFDKFSQTFPGEGAYLVTLKFTGDLSQPVPEPQSWALLGAGLLGLGAVARRRQR